MAGSYKMLVDEDGRFTMDLIENLGDAAEALEECVTIIAEYENDETRTRRELAYFKRIMKTINLASINALVAIRRIVDESADALDPEAGR